MFLEHPPYHVCSAVSAAILLQVNCTQKREKQEKCKVSQLPLLQLGMHYYRVVVVESVRRKVKRVRIPGRRTFGQMSLQR